MSINFPTIEKKSKTKPSFSSFIEKIDRLLAGKVSLKEKLFFTQYLGLMLKAGISLSAALSALAKQTEDKNFSRVLFSVAKNVERGASFAESLRVHEKVFGELYINMIEAGEVSGKLEEVLTNLYLQTKKQHEINSKVKGALIYPVTIVIAMVVVGIFMFIFVVPELLGIIQSYEVELPLPTKIFIFISEFLMNHGIISILLVVVLGLFLAQIMRTYYGKYYWQALILKIPIFSSIVKKINLAHFSRIISTLLKTDIMIIKSFQIAAKTLNNLHYRKAVVAMSEKLKKGSQLHEAVVSYPDLFPPSVSQMIAIGEKTGELDNVLAELAEFYETEVSQTMDNLPSIIEPILIVLLGIMVAMIAAAITMPYYSLISAI